MSAGLSLYRAATTVLGAAAPLLGALRLLAPRRSAWRGALTGADAAAARAAGSVWVHAASMGEVGAARVWIDALAGAGLRTPLLLTTRTRAGLARAERDLGDRVAARIAPADLPQLLRALLEAATPSRLDVVETEIWPNLILEARRAGLAVVFVGAAVTERSARRLRAGGLSGVPLFGEGVFVLARDERHAARFLGLGAAESRVAVIGDLKADAPASVGNLVPPGARSAVVFGSFRPGEEAAAVAIADSLARSEESAGPGRRRPILVVAPRHEAGASRARQALARAGYAVLARAEADRPRAALGEWIARAASEPGRRAALLATRGELAEAYGFARVAVIGGTFAPYGGHNALEAAARGCPVIAGPYHEEIVSALAALARERAGAGVADPASAGALAAAWWSDGHAEERSESALRAAREAAGAAARGLRWIQQWGLVP